MKKLKKGEMGFTLIEMLVVLVIIGIITGGITAGIKQVLTINTRASNHMIAVRQVQQAGKEVSKDALQAQSVNATGAGWDFILTLTWEEWGTNQTHSVNYTLENMPGEVKQLQRSHTIDSGDPTLTRVAQYIDDTIDIATGKAKTRCEWDPVERVLVFTVTATLGSGSYGASETRIYQIEPRPD